MLNFLTPLMSEVATHGSDAAIFLDFVRKRIKFLQRNEAYRREGRTWIPRTMMEWTEDFPQWHPQKIRRIIVRLVEAGELIKGCFNARAADRKTWIALCDEEGQIAKIPRKDRNPPKQKIAYPKRVPTEGTKPAESAAHSPPDDGDVRVNGHFSSVKNENYTNEISSNKVKKEDLKKDLKIPPSAVPEKKEVSEGRIAGCKRLLQEIVLHYSPPVVSFDLNDLGEPIPVGENYNWKIFWEIIETVTNEAGHDYEFFKQWHRDWMSLPNPGKIQFTVARWRCALWDYQNSLFDRLG